jgi:hypothetical protein
LGIVLMGSGFRSGIEMENREGSNPFLSTEKTLKSIYRCRKSLTVLFPGLGKPSGFQHLIRFV